MQLIFKALAIIPICDNSIVLAKLTAEIREHGNITKEVSDVFLRLTAHVGSHLMQCSI